MNMRKYISGMRNEYTIAITTRNRPDSFNRVYEACNKYTDNIIVVDDASEKPYANSTYRFDDRVGIPRAKNKCIEIFMKTKSQNLFLLDDDVIPIHHESFTKYIENGTKHLCYTFYKPYKNVEGLKLHQLGNGCMMYFHRACFDIVGGFDTRFGLGKYEHVDLSRRIHNIGLTKYRFADVIGSSELFYSMDKNKEVKRSFTSDEEFELLTENQRHFIKQANSIEYIDYRL